LPQLPIISTLTPRPFPQPRRHGESNRKEVPSVLGAKYISILALLGVGLIMVIQMVQGEANALHWFGLGAIVIGLIAVTIDIQKSRQA
jgi:hypothetical protein